MLSAFGTCGVRDMYLIHPSSPAPGMWVAKEDGRDGKGILGTGTEFPKIFLSVFLFHSNNDVGDKHVSVTMLSYYFLLLFCLSFTELLWFRKHHYSSKVVLGDVIVNCVGHAGLFSLHTKCAF